MLDMQIPGGLDRGQFYPGFHLYMVSEAWQRGAKKLWPIKDPEEGCKFWEVRA